MRALHRIAAAAAAVAAVLGLAACAGLPTTGYVEPGDQVGVVSDDARWQITPDGPVEGASAEAIVLGFLGAGEGPADDWATAREFLSDDFAKTWDPSAGVTIESINDRVVGDFSPDESADAGSVTARITATATVDAMGAYHPVTDGSRVDQVQFQLVREDGEWRISSAPDGVVVQSENFRTIFASAALAFPAVAGDQYVPDVRWVPDTAGQAQRLVELLLGGPSPWLAASVTTAFDGIELGSRGVSIDDTSATVDLSSAARDTTSDARAVMAGQLQQTLASVGVTSVSATSGGSRLALPNVTVQTATPDARALVLTEDGFGFLGGSDLTDIDGLSDAVVEAAGVSSPDPAVQISVSADQQTAAILTKSGAIRRVTADGEVTTQMTASDGASIALDPFGYTWAGWDDGSSNLAYIAPDGTTMTSAPTLEEYSGITTLEVSRDGMRLAIAGRLGDDDVISIVGIQRDADGVVTGLSDPMVVGTTDEPVHQIGWVTDRIVAAAVETGDDRTSVVEQTVGGLAERISAPFEVVGLAYGNPTSNERVLTSDGDLYVRRTTTWLRSGGGVVVLATQLGAPAE
ncbi:GerMN domain-containing protein [Microbacterium indicum]|uniref:GerMN domain-containing protein n=1 Tax=Microbacterium indicum TaxID=358100 RepID=UPI000412D64A|nr:GerMN domain-containing protein [Microbacterium indicum]